MARKSISPKIIVSAFVITTLIFLAGLFIGYSINKEKLGDVETRVIDIKKNIDNFQLQFLFLETLGDKAACPLLADTLQRIDKESYEIGDRLTLLSSSNDLIDDAQYNELKSEYSRSLVGYWLLAKKLNNACNLKSRTILYFYDRDCETCDNQGFILTALKNKYKQNVLVFALDARLEEPGIATLKEYYKVSQYPTLVIDDSVYTGLQSLSSLQDKMGLQ